MEMCIDFSEDYARRLSVTLDDALKIKEHPTWSRKYNKCIICGSVTRKHVAKGLCTKCYQFENEKKQKKHPRTFGVATKTLKKEYIVEEYLNKKRSMGDIARDCYCTRQFIYKKIKSYNIPLRDKSSARKLALERKKLKFERINENGKSHFVELQKLNFNVDFFSYWSPEMAWVLGLIFSDGTLKKTRPYFRIYQKEPEVLNKIKTLMKCNVKLIHRKKNSYKGVVSGDLFTLQIYNQKSYDDLLKLGLKPDKSLDIEFPQMPPEYVRHFIRGCWDGDGSVYIERERGKIRASYISGSFNFIKGMLYELEKAGLPKRTIYTTKRKNKSYYFRFHGSQCEKLYHYLYDNVPREQYLEIKHDIFEMGNGRPS